jgi:hypothetical protein
MAEPIDETDPFEQALAGLKQVFVDIDGDGKPDAVVAQPTSRPAGRVASPTDWVNGPNRFALPQPEMRSFQPTAGDDARVGVNRMLSVLGPEVSQRLGNAAGAVVDYGPIPAKVATEVAMQPVRAGDAVATAAIDPTLANITNAAAQTGMAVGSPVLTLGSLGAGYAEALRRDLGAGVTPAQAQTKTASLPGLTPEQMSQYNDAERRIRNGSFRNGAERRALEGTLQGLRDLSNQTVLADRAAQTQLKVRAGESEQDEYNRSVGRAEQARDAALARDRRFSDTEVGKLWDKTGGLAPVAAGALTGAASRLATGGGNLLHNYALPGGLGVAAGAAANNVPLAYNAILTEPDNPQKRAYEAYARELPPNHPRKQEFADYAASLPAENQVRKAASEEFYDPEKLKERAIMGGIEGGLAGMVGADLVRMAGRPVSAVLGGSKNRGTAVAEPENRLLREASTRDGVAQRLEGATIDDALPARSGTSGQPSQSTLPAARQSGQQAQQSLPAPRSESLTNQATPEIPPMRRKDKNGRTYYHDRLTGHRTSKPGKQEEGKPDSRRNQMLPDEE